MDNMVKIVHLPVEQLRGIKNNPFPELSDQEYKDLKGSIIQYGILEPLIVIKQNGSSYEVISGNHRLRVAKEIGLKNVPCSIIDLGRLEGAFDTEIFRRHINKSDRDKYVKLKKEGATKRIEQELSYSLIPELYQLYKDGILPAENAVFISVMNVERQKALYNSFMEWIKDKKSKNEQKEQNEQNKQEGELSALGKKIEDLEKKLSQKEEELSKLQEWKNKKQEEFAKQIEELQREKEKEKEKEVDTDNGKYKELEEQFAQQYQQLWEVNENLRHQIRMKENDIEKAKEERDKAIAELRRKEDEIKIQATKKDIEMLEKKRTFLIGMINKYIGTITEAASGLERCETDCLLNRQIANIRKELQKAMHKLWKLDEKLASLETRPVH